METPERRLGHSAVRFNPKTHKIETFDPNPSDTQQAEEEHFAGASGDARLGLIWEKLKKIEKALEDLKR